jgi:hypothetical protein
MVEAGGVGIFKAIENTQLIDFSTGTYLERGTFQPLANFVKGSQGKTHLLPEFFLLPSPRAGARSVLTWRAMDSGCGHSGPAIRGFSTGGFIACSRRNLQF